MTTTKKRVHAIWVVVDPSGKPHSWMDVWAFDSRKAARDYLEPDDRLVRYVPAPTKRKRRRK